MSDLALKSQWQDDIALPDALHTLRLHPAVGFGQFSSRHNGERGVQGALYLGRIGARAADLIAGQSTCSLGSCTCVYRSTWPSQVSGKMAFYHYVKSTL